MARYVIVLFFSLFTLSGSAQKIPLIHSGDVIEKGKALYDSGAFAAAVKEFYKVPERDTNYVLMLTEAALAQLGAKQYDDVLALCEKGVTKPSPYAPYFYRYRAIAEDKKGKLETSVKVFQEGINKFPADYGLLYNLGITYYNNKQYEKAKDIFFQVLSFNPFHAGSHLNLGRMAIGQGRKTHAMLSLGMYLSISNSDNERLVLLNNFLDNQVTDEGSIPVFGVNEAEKLDQIIRAKLAMDKEFKGSIPVTAAVVRQYEMLFQQMNLIGTNDSDAWVRTYMPIYRFMKENKLMEPFVYHLLSSSSNNVVKKWHSKNKKELTGFFEGVNTIIKKQRERIGLPQFGYEEPVSAWYFDDNSLSALGTANAQDVRTGPWKFYYSNHALSAEGGYSSNGKKTGIWKYYYNDGTTKSIEDYATGEVTVYYPDGVKREHFYLKDGNIDGEVELFFPCGPIKEKLMYAKGHRHGKGNTYHEDGTLRMSYEYFENKGNGEFKTYDVNGVLREVETYKNDVLTGDYRAFFANGKVESEGQYVNGKATGGWVHYYQNGAVKRKGVYNNIGNPNGEWVYFDESGALTERRLFDEEGRRNGPNTHYFEDKVHYVDTYKKDVLIQSVFYDRDGKELSNNGKADGNFAARNFFMTGELHSEGSYLKGEKHGPWKYYNRFGKLINEYNYLEGQLQGAAIDYFPSGEKKFLVEYENDKLHGYFQEFFRHGQVKQEGWYQEGNRQQQWLSYFADGTLAADSYYLDNYLTGDYFTYDQDGKADGVGAYKGNRMVDVKHLDIEGNDITAKKTTGYTQNYEERFSNKKLKSKFDVLCGNYVGPMTRWYPDGTVYYSYSFVNGKKNGPYVYNHLNGMPALQGSYLHDEETGIWKRFHMNGRMIHEGKYVAGKKDSVWNYYFPNGNISSSISCRNGESHGVSRYFTPEGTPLMEKMYLYDDVVAYRIVYENEENAPWQKFSGTATIIIKTSAGAPIYEERYEGGLREGARRLYYNNGKLAEEYSYVRGDYEGPFATYFPNGNVEERGAFSNDEIQGKVETFRPDGSLLKTETYGMGTRHGVATYFDKGNKKEIVFRDGTIQ